MTRIEAETTALGALAWVAGHEELLPRFAGSTGASLDDMRGRAQDPVFLASVLEFLTSEDRWIAAFCDEQGLPYEAPMRALVALGGGRRDEWP